LSVVVLIDTGADPNCIQEGLVPTKYYSKSKETLRSANGSNMQITFEINKAHVCQDNVCFKTKFVLVKNMTDKVILCLPFITLLYPFTTNHDGLITYPMDEKVKFKFLASPELSQLDAYKSNSISKSFNMIKSKTPTAFWHRKKHTVSLPYVKDFDEGNITTKARPIQMSQETMEFCRNKV
jgi:hypothetical protein